MGASFWVLPWLDGSQWLDAEFGMFLTGPACSSVVLCGPAWSLQFLGQLAASMYPHSVLGWRALGMGPWFEKTLLTSL